MGIGRLLRAARRQPVDATPVWFMRQAGRSLPEYRALREKHPMLEIARTPELAAAVSLQPVRRLGVDAAIVFADITLPLPGMGVAFELTEGVGPVIGHPVRTAADVAALRVLDPHADLPYVAETIRTLKAEVPAGVDVIGFAAAPFTLASYMVEGRGSRDFAHVKAMMLGAPDLWHAMMGTISASTVAYLRMQVEAGADAIQLFDSWVGALAPRDYAEFVQPHTRAVFAALRGTVSLIHFGTGSATLLPLMRGDGADVVSVDWRIGLGDAWSLLGPDLAIQGNLDPAALLGPWEAVRVRADEILADAAGRPGHIFNLGHGVLPSTSPDQLARLVDHVHAWRPPAW